MERDKAQQIAQEVTHLIIVPFQSGIKQSYSINHEGRLYLILYMFDPDERGMELRLYCVERGQTPSPLIVADQNAVVMVFMNGALLAWPTEYSVVSGKVVLLIAITTDDVIRTITFPADQGAAYFDLTPAVDGVQTEFILPPRPPGLVQIYQNSILLAEGGDYSLSDNQLTLTYAPERDDLLRCYVLPSLYSLQILVGDGVKTVFTLDPAPRSGIAEMVFLNPLLLEAGTDYVIDGSTITFSFAPWADDLVRVYC